MTASSPRPLRLLLTRPIPERGMELLRESGAEVQLLQSEDEAPVPRRELLQAVEGADALLSLLTETVDLELLEAGAKLRGVANYAVGVDNIDLASATELGIPVSNTPGILTETTADLTWALLLATARRIPEGDQYVREGHFTIWGPRLLLGTDVGPGGDETPKTLGLIGFGRIGQAVARRAVGFGMRILAHARAPIPPLPGLLEVEQVSLDRLLQESDFVSLHLPLTGETQHLLDAARLRSMRETAILINTSRGPIVDEAALVQLLREGRLAGAGLDVFEEEPTVHPGLLELPNVVLAPHIGSASRRTRSLMAEFAVLNAIHHLRGEVAPNALNPSVYSSEAWRLRTAASIPH